MAIVSRTPKHYLLQTGADVSGEALIAMEAPLVAKVKRHTKNFSVTWVELGKFLAKLKGIDLSNKEVKTVWEPAQSVQPKTQAETIKTLKDAGLPFTAILRWAGFDDAEIAEIIDELEDEKEHQKTMAQLAVEAARARQAQSNEYVAGEEEPEPEEEAEQ